MFKILKNKIVANAGWLIAGRIIHMLLTFFIGLMTARYLGPDNYGLINYAAAYVTFFVSLCNLGINSVIVKNFVDYPDEAGETVGTTLLLRGISSTLSVIAIILITFFVDKGEPTTVLVVALYSFSVVFQIYDTFNYWFQYRLQSKYVSIASSISYALVSVYMVWLLVTGKSVIWFAVSNSLEYIITGLITYLSYKKCGGPALSFSLAKGKQLLRVSKSFIVAGLMVSVYASTDKLMLKHLMGSAEVGYYTTAATISGLCSFVLSAVIDSMYPSIMQTFREDKVRFERRNRQMYAAVFYISALASLVISVFARLIVRLLYGAQFYPAVGPLRIVCWYTAFSYLGVARNAWMVCYDCQRYLKYLYIGSAGVNVVLNLLLIPGMGASGAAIASLITQITTTLVFPALMKDLRPNAKLMLEAILLRDVLPKH